jgi:2,3-dihydroxybiphenyl 1,2-dioxygenase
MERLIQVGYLGIETSDRAAFDAYLGGVLGLAPGAGDSDGDSDSDSDGSSSTWRMDAKSYRFALHDGPADDIAYLGLEAPDASSFTAAVARLEAAGATVTAGSQDEKRQRRVEDLAWTPAPWGGRVEIVRGLAEAAEPYDSPLVPGGFVTAGLGLGHAVFMYPVASPDGAKGYDEAVDFVEQALGMVLSDWLETELGGARVLVRFYHCNGRHHSLALVAVPAPALPRAAHHIMIETVSADNVGMAYDRALAADVPIPMGLGRHDNDRMFSFYSICPSGFQFEFGSDGVIVGDDWPVKRFERISAWGHHPVNAPGHPNA